MTDPTTVQTALDDAGYRRTDARRSIADLRAVVRDIEQTTGYLIDDHRLELFGRCPACRKTID